MGYVSYGVRELQAHLGKALAAAKSGEIVYITSRVKIVAILSKADRNLPGEATVDRKLRRLASEGKIQLGKPGLIAPYRLPRMGGLTDQLLSDRR